MKIIVLTILCLGFLSGCIIYPEREVYVPVIVGLVVDSEGNAIVGAKVSRIENRRIYENEHKYTTEKYASQTVITDAEGRFTLPKKVRIDWWHNLMDLPFIWCYGHFQVTHQGYISYKTEFDDYSYFNEKSVGCEGVEFEPTVVLPNSN